MPFKTAKSGPAYRLHKARNLAVVTIKGRDYYLGAYDSPESRQKYHRLLAEHALTNVLPEKIPEPEPATSGDRKYPDLMVSELIRRFLREQDGYYRRADGTPTGELDNYKHAFSPLKKLYDGAQAQDVGPIELKLVRQSMVDAGLSRKVINRRVQRIVALIAYAVENELVPPSNRHVLKAVKALGKGRSKAPDRKKVGPPVVAHVEAALPYLSRQLQAVVRLQMLTGARSTEALLMRGCDLDMTGSAWQYIPSRHKTDHLDIERRIFLGPKAQMIVREWLRSDPNEFLFSPREARAEWNATRRAGRRSPMTPSQRDRRPKDKPKRAPRDYYDARAYGHAVRRACDKAGVPVWHAHQLRHLAATNLKREFGVEVARVVLGHSSPAMTEHYVERDFAQAREAMATAG